MSRTTIETPQTEQTAGAAEFLWLDLTRKCQLTCTHCYNDSGPTRGHGTMTRADWLTTIDQAARLGVRRVQLIGGEPTLHPGAPRLVTHALGAGLSVEVYSNMVSVKPRWWELLRREGMSVATSYYSDQAAQHNKVTGRASHARTRANIAKALRLGVPLRVGIVDCGDGLRVDEARRELEQMGVTRVHVDHQRPYGRAAQGQNPRLSGLCGEMRHRS